MQHVEDRLLGSLRHRRDRVAGRLEDVLSTAIYSRVELYNGRRVSYFDGVHKILESCGMIRTNRRTLCTYLRATLVASDCNDVVAAALTRVNVPLAVFALKRPAFSTPMNSAGVKAEAFWFVPSHVKSRPPVTNLNASVREYYVCPNVANLGDVSPLFLHGMQRQEKQMLPRCVTNLPNLRVLAIHPECTGVPTINPCKLGLSTRNTPLRIDVY